MKRLLYPRVTGSKVLVLSATRTWLVWQF